MQPQLSSGLFFCGGWQNIMHYISEKQAQAFLLNLVPASHWSWLLTRSTTIGGVCGSGGGPGRPQSLLILWSNMDLYSLSLMQPQPVIGLFSGNSGRHFGLHTRSAKHAQAFELNVVPVSHYSWLDTRLTIIGGDSSMIGLGLSIGLGLLLGLKTLSRLGDISFRRLFRQGRRKYLLKLNCSVSAASTVTASMTKRIDFIRWNFNFQI